MADGTKIEWTDATVNAVNGCSVLSPGCTNCYAMKLAGTRLRNHPSRAGLTQATKTGPVWTGEVRLNEKALLEPLRWRRPRRIFWNAHGDLFHENVPDEWIDRCFAVMALTPQHQHQVLTKRAERMRTWASSSLIECRVGALICALSTLAPGRNIAAQALERLAAWPLPNVWLGVSVEDQARADERIPHLLATPAAVRFLSCEPLLGPVDLTGVIPDDDSYVWQPLRGVRFNPMEPPHYGDKEEATGKIDWVIVGGQSGPKARPMHPDWARSLRDQCAAAGVPFFFKQWGEWRLKPGCDLDLTLLNLRAYDERYLDEGTCGPFIRVGKKAAGRLLDGVEHDGMPS